MTKKSKTKQVMNMTKQQLHEEKKKEMNESLEYLRQVDNSRPEEEGRKFVVEQIQAENEEEQKIKDNVLTDLQTKQHAQFIYRQKLCEYADEKLSKIVPFGWGYFVFPTDGSDIMLMGQSRKTKIGVVFLVKNPTGQYYYRAVETTQDPMIDMNSMNILCVQVENTIDSEKGLLLSDNKDSDATMKKTPSGIYIP